MMQDFVERVAEERLWLQAVQGQRELQSGLLLLEQLAEGSGQVLLLRSLLWGVVRYGADEASR